MTIPEEALVQMQAWLQEAIDHEPDVPDAMQIATVGADGRPTLRTVLLKALDADGVIFYTNLHSRKGRALTQNPAISALLHWKSLERQLMIDGTVTPVSEAQADAYFATRPRGSQIGAWASLQSSTLDDYQTLLDRFTAFEARFDGEPVPRPPHWSGFRILPDRIELWQGYPSRLHERRVWSLQADQWHFSRLYP